MIKIIISGLLFLCCTLSSANTLSNSIIYGIGERKTEVNWNIAGNLVGTNPNIISELTWNNIKSHQFLLGGILMEKDYFLQLFGEYGTIHAGENQDSDYNLDNRKGEFSRSVNNAGKGYLLDGEINYGKDYFFSGKLKVSPMIGYGFHRQKLRIYDGNQVIGSADLTGLDSLYQANWHGPQVGISLNYKKNSNVVSFNYGYQDISFYGHADWNLRSDLKHPKSMTQQGSGSGTKISGSFEHAISNLSSLSLVMNHYNYSATGEHTFHLLSIDPSQKLNQVNWKGVETKLVYRSLF